MTARADRSDLTPVTVLGMQEAPRFSDHVDLDNLQRCGNVMAGKDGADGPEGLKLKIEGDSERFCQADLLLSGANTPAPLFRFPRVLCAFFSLLLSAHTRCRCVLLPLYFGHDKAPESDVAMT